MHLYGATTILKGDLPDVCTAGVSAGWTTQWGDGRAPRNVPVQSQSAAGTPTGAEARASL